MSFNNDFGGCAGNSAAPSASAAPLSPAAAAPSFTLLPWMREDAQSKHAFCLRAEERIAGGMPVRRACSSRFFTKQVYQEKPAKKARRSSSSLVNMYYRWRRNGRNPDCLIPKFGSKLAPVPAELLQRFIGACATPGVTKFSQAERLVGSQGFRQSRIRAALGGKALRKIQAVFELRRRDEAEIAKAIRRLQAMQHRRLAADVARAARLRELAGKLAQ
jgi:hypothetical protein